MDTGAAAAGRPIRIRVLVTDDWGMRYVDEIREDFPGLEVVREPAADIEVVIGRIVPEDLVRLPQVKWIQALSAGVEWLRGGARAGGIGGGGCQRARGPCRHHRGAHVRHADLPVAPFRSSVSGGNRNASG